MAEFIAHTDRILLHASWPATPGAVPPNKPVGFGIWPLWERLRRNRQGFISESQGAGYGHQCHDWNRLALEGRNLGNLYRIRHN